MINGVVALLIGMWLIMVVWNGNESRMLATISDQVGFLKWIGALLTAAYIYANVDGKNGEIVKSFIMIALAAMLLKNGEQMFAEFNKAFSPAQKPGKVSIKTTSEIIKGGK